MMKPLIRSCIFAVCLASNAFAGSPKIDFTPTVKGDFQVQVDINTDGPDAADLSVSLSKHGLADNDPFVGTDFIKAPVNGGKASALVDAGKKPIPSLEAIVKGDYDIEVHFYPRWAENRKIAEGMGIVAPISVAKVVQLNGNGKGEEYFAKQKKKMEDRGWVMENVHQGMKWNGNLWQSKFGKPEAYDPTSGNPKVLQMYYFKGIDMTVMVNTLKNEIVTWRDGKVCD